MAPWKLPVIAAALTLPIVAGFLVAGPALGTALGALAVFAILVVAARQRPRGPIGQRPADDGPRRVLVVITGPLDEPAAVREVARLAGLDRVPEEADVLLLAPARIGFLDRWASDVEGARQAAQRNLVAAVAAFAKAGIVAEARVGDEDVVQAVEDQLQSFPASAVVLVSEIDGDGGAGEAAAELNARLRAEFRHLVLGSG
jgi:hypothetical protein